MDRFQKYKLQTVPNRTRSIQQQNIQFHRNMSNSIQNNKSAIPRSHIKAYSNPQLYPYPTTQISRSTLKFFYIEYVEVKR